MGLTLCELPDKVTNTQNHTMVLLQAIAAGPRKPKLYKWPDQSASGPYTTESRDKRNDYPHAGKWGAGKGKHEVQQLDQ